MIKIVLTPESALDLLEILVKVENEKLKKTANYLRNYLRKSFVALSEEAVLSRKSTYDKKKFESWELEIQKKLSSNSEQSSRDQQTDYEKLVKEFSNSNNTDCG